MGSELDALSFQPRRGSRLSRRAAGKILDLLQDCFIETRPMRIGCAGRDRCRASCDWPETASKTTVNTPGRLTNVTGSIPPPAEASGLRGPLLKVLTVQGLVELVLVVRIAHPRLDLGFD